MAKYAKIKVTEKQGSAFTSKEITKRNVGMTWEQNKKHKKIACIFSIAIVLKLYTFR